MNAAAPPCPRRIVLAPMHGLLDELLRARICAIGGYDAAVTPFVRVSGNLMPARAFINVAPELQSGGCTAGATPVIVQLLGSDPALLAANAARLAALNPAGIDLNFGCPAPTVNRHGGGASLLASPELLFAISRAVGAALPAGLPFSAKMRLGISDPERALDCAAALVAGGIDTLVVHARTRADAYRPPARWEWLGRIRQAISVPLVANGEIWTPDDWRRCREIAGDGDLMLARGAVADPFLARRLRGSAPATPSEAEWPALLPTLAAFWQDVRAKVAPRHAPGRLKLWLGYLSRTWQSAAELSARLRRIEDSAAISRLLDDEVEQAAKGSSRMG